jgi:hypothetical protein
MEGGNNPDFDPGGGIIVPDTFSPQYAGYVLNVPFSIIGNFEFAEPGDLIPQKERALAAIEHLIDRFGVEMDSIAPGFTDFLKRLQLLLQLEDWREAATLFSLAKETWDFSGLAAKIAEQGR